MHFLYKKSQKKRFSSIFLAIFCKFNLNSAQYPFGAKYKGLSVHPAYN